MKKEKMSENRKNELSSLWVLIAAFMFVFIGSVIVMSEHQKEKDVMMQTIDKLSTENTALKDSIDSLEFKMSDLYKLSWDNIDYWINYFSIMHPEIVKAQIYEETGNLSSTICLYNHNLFGMRLAYQRETTATGERSGFATYGSYIESIIDYAIWQKTYYDNPEEDYYRFLERSGYCHPDAATYTSKLKRIVNDSLTNY